MLSVACLGNTSDVFPERYRRLNRGLDGLEVSR